MILEQRTTAANCRRDFSRTVVTEKLLRKSGCDVEHRDGYRLVVGGPVPPQAAAITLGRTIVVRRESASNSQLLAHELVHVRQFRERGIVRFLVAYVGAYVANRFRGHGHLAAYRRIPLEVEACWDSTALAASTSAGANRISPSKE